MDDLDFRDEMVEILDNVEKKLGMIGDLMLQTVNCSEDNLDVKRRTFVAIGETLFDCNTDLSTIHKRIANYSL